ncbi:unnamed protein product, partial [Brenthis ino]
MLKLVVLSVAVALVAAEPSVIAPLWGGHLAAPLVAGPLAAGLVAPVVPLSLLYPSAPLDTLDVNVDRAVHYTAKALNGVHFLKKRSLVAPWGAPVGLPLAARVAAPAPIAVAAAAPVAALGWGHGVRLGHIW